MRQRIDASNASDLNQPLTLTSLHPYTVYCSSQRRMYVSIQPSLIHPIHLSSNTSWVVGNRGAPRCLPASCIHVLRSQLVERFFTGFE